MKADLTDSETDAGDHSHSHIGLSISQLHEHDLLMFHWCLKSFPICLADNDDLTAAVDDACNYNCVIQSHSIV